jgi:hypothetical protein
MGSEPAITLRVHPKVAKLTGLIYDAEQLLRKYGEATWANWLAVGNTRIRNRDFGGVEHILSGFGGMGSFTDVYICPTNHHLIEERDVNRVNDRLRALSSAIYILAKEHKREEEG